MFSILFHSLLNCPYPPGLGHSNATSNATRDSEGSWLSAVVATITRQPINRFDGGTKLNPKRKVLSKNHHQQHQQSHTTHESNVTNRCMSIFILEVRYRWNTNINTHRHTLTNTRTHTHEQSIGRKMTNGNICYHISAVFSIYLPIYLYIYTYVYVYHTLIYPKSSNLITIYINYWSLKHFYVSQ